MITLEGAIDLVLADPLRDVRAHRDGIGYVGPDIPMDLLLATERPVCHLPWHADRPTPHADRWLESAFPGWARSMLEDWHAGRFDCLSQVVLSRACDASQRLYYYLCELRRRGDLKGPEPLIFDMALVPRDSSLLRTTWAVSHLAGQLDVDERAMAHGIARANRQRRLFGDLQSARKHAGVLYEKISRASLYTDLAPLLEEGGLPAALAIPPAPAHRLVLAGSAPVDERLHLAAESAGAVFVAEAHVHGLLRLGLPMEEGTMDPARTIAQHLRRNSIGPRSFIDRAAWLLGQARHADARAVVLWLTMEEEALGWHVPAQRKSLEEAGLPSLILTGRHWSVDDGAGDAIRTFAGGLS